MAKQTINIGSSANDGTGSTLRAGGDLINDNFNEIYTALGDGSTLSPVTASSTHTFTNKTYDLGGTGNSFTGSLAEFNTSTIKCCCVFIKTISTKYDTSYFTWYCEVCF